MLRRWCVRSFVCSFVRGPVRSWACSFVRGSVRSIVGLFVRGPVRSWLCSFMGVFVRWSVRSWVCSFIRWSVRSFVGVFACGVGCLLLVLVCRSVACLVGVLRSGVRVFLRCSVGWWFRVLVLVGVVLLQYWVMRCRGVALLICAAALLRGIGVAAQRERAGHYCLLFIALARTKILFDIFSLPLPGNVCFS